MNHVETAAELLEAVRRDNPLVQCITNFVTVNDCANVLLAAGASPTMAHHVEEAGEIAAIASALVLNMGTADSTEAMLVAGQSANESGVPVVLDPVAAGVSGLRRKVAKELLTKVKFAVIRGNASEIASLVNASSSAKGVDAGAEDLVRADRLEPTLSHARALAEETGAVVVVSGPVDLVVSTQQVVTLSNGSATMPRVTGSGCMLTALTGAYCGVTKDYFAAALAATAAMGVSGDLAQAKMDAKGTGTATFRIDMIDALSLLDGETLKGRMKDETIA